MTKTMLATTITGKKIPVPVIVVSEELGVQQAFFIGVNNELEFIKDSYIVVHTPTGLRTCHTYFTQPEAVALAKELSTLPGWERIRSDTDPRRKGYGERNKASVGSKFLTNFRQIVEKHAKASKRYLVDEPVHGKDGRDWRK